MPDQQALRPQHPMLAMHDISQSNAGAQPEPIPVPLGLCIFDAQARLIVCSDDYMQMYGLSRATVKAGCSLTEVFAQHNVSPNFPHSSGEQSAERYTADVLAAMRAGKSFHHFMDLSDGRIIYIAHQPLPDGTWASAHADVTEPRRIEEDLRRTQSFFDTVIENMPVGLWVEDTRDFRLLLTNKVGEDIMGMRREQAIGKTAYDILPKEAADWVAAHNRQLVENATSAAALGEQWFHNSSGGPRLVSSKKLVVRGPDGNPQYLLSLGEDITERKRAEEQIAHLAHYDALTDLPNRAAFDERLSFTIERTAQTNGSFAVLSVDLDRFKEVNDVFGHAMGDELLRRFSQRLMENAENAFLARLGGDEFMLIVSEGPFPAAAATLAERLLASTEHDYQIGDNRIHVGVSIGVAFFPTDGADATTLLGNADAALYRAKVEGRGLIRFFEAEMDERLRLRRSMQHELRTAVEHHQLRLNYQPQARIDGTIIGFEALARWRHPKFGEVPPATFIPLAEESGLIIPMGKWVLREACREAASWPRPLQIAINLSPVQFRHGDLPELVHSVLLETGLAASRLELEITEGVLINDFSRSVSILRRLKGLGVRVAMDDFGTGYSSLAYLQSFPFDKIKIDKGFISNLERSAQSIAIVRAVIGLGRGLDLPVIAEGVETKDQLEFLSREDCSEIQGFLIGRPEPIERYAELVGRQTSESAAAAKQSARAG